MATTYNTNTYTIAPYATTTSTNKNALDTSLVYVDPAMESIAATQLPPIAPHYNPTNTYAKEAAYMSTLPTSAEITAKAIKATTGEVPTEEEKKRPVGYYRKKKPMKNNLKRIIKVAKTSNKMNMNLKPINKDMGSLKGVKLLKLKNMDNMVKISKIAKIIKRGSK